MNHIETLNEMKARADKIISEARSEGFECTEKFIAENLRIWRGWESHGSNVRKFMQTINNMFEKLWNHVTGACSNKPSAVSLAIKEPLEEELAKEYPNPKALYKIERRIARHDDFEYFKTSMVSRVTGEWHITNADLRFWADMCLFGERDLFHGKFRFLTSGIRRALYDKCRLEFDTTINASELIDLFLFERKTTGYDESLRE